jgi:hypothetical protein
MPRSGAYLFSRARPLDFSPGARLLDGIRVAVQAIPESLRGSRPGVLRAKGLADFF